MLALHGVHEEMQTKNDVLLLLRSRFEAFAGHVLLGIFDEETAGTLH